MLLCEQLAHDFDVVRVGLALLEGPRRVPVPAVGEFWVFMRIFGLALALLSLDFGRFRLGLCFFLNNFGLFWGRTVLPNELVDPHVEKV